MAPGHIDWMNGQHCWPLIHPWFVVEYVEHQYTCWTIQSKTVVTDVEDRGGEGDLAESLARLILEADPAIAGVGAAERPVPSPGSSGSCLSALQGLDRPRVLPKSSSISHPTQPHQHPHHPQHQLPPGPSTSGENSDCSCFIISWYSSRTYEHNISQHLEGIWFITKGVMISIFKLKYTEIKSQFQTWN